MPTTRDTVVEKTEPLEATGELMLITITSNATLNCCEVVAMT